MSFVLNGGIFSGLGGGVFGLLSVFGGFFGLVVLSVVGSFGLFVGLVGYVDIV